MDQLESQVAKIQIGNFKKTNSYVHVLAEKAGASDAELYVVIELPLFNPAAENACEHTALAITSALLRAYKRPANENTFENAIAQINEELGKLVSLGQTQWLDKLNCIIAVKDGVELHIATCGKVSAYLFRNGEFTDVSCSPTQTHPLKTFENIASGKLKLGDVVILSTAQLFNYLAIDRLKILLLEDSFLVGAQTVIEILKENADPEVAFGTILNLQVETGKTQVDQIDLEEYQTQKSAPGQNIFAGIVAYVKNILVMNESSKRIPTVRIPKINMANAFKNIGGNTKSALYKSGGVLSGAGRSVFNSRKKLNVENFKNFSRQKKFFFASVVVLLFAVIINIIVASHYKKIRLTTQQVSGNLQQTKDLISKAQSSLLYKDNAAAEKYLAQAQDKLPKATDIPASSKNDYATIQTQLVELTSKIDKVVVVSPTTTANLGQSPTLLKLPPYLATQTGGTMVSLNLQNGLVQDGALLSSAKITNAISIKQNTAVVYNGQALLMWDYDKKIYGNPFTQNVPASSDAAGLAFYTTNSRAYMIDRKNHQIISFLIGKDISKPVIAASNAGTLADAIDITIDGSVYVLNKNGVEKYQAGQLADFRLPALLKPFSGSGKIYTEKGWNNIYILDVGNHRVIVIDKKGNLVETLTSNQFSDLKDFSVNEANKTLYVLNDTVLLKVSLP